MDSFSTMHWLIVSCFFIAVPALIMKMRTSRTFLVLRHFELGRKPNNPELPIVEIVGRHAGIIAYILSILQLANQSTFRVSSASIEFENSSLFGQRKKFVPLCRVASITAGVHKPIGYLIATVVILFLGIVGSFEAVSVIPLAIMIVIAAVFVIAYFISKSIILEVTSNAGVEISMQFRPGIIEGVPIDTEKALAATNVICDLILMKQPAIEDFSVNHNGYSSPSYARPIGNPPAPPPLSERMNSNTNHSISTVMDIEQEAWESLRKAVQIYNSGQMDSAINSLKSIVTQFPSTKAAQKAKENLTRLGY